MVIPKLCKVEGAISIIEVVSLICDGSLPLAEAVELVIGWLLFDSVVWLGNGDDLASIGAG